MPDILSDGTASWLGGMDTSRSAAEIGEAQYSKATNVIIPTSLGGIRARFGFHCCSLTFQDKATKNIYRNGSVQGEGYYDSGSGTRLIVVVDGYVLRFTRISGNGFAVDNINLNDRNKSDLTHAWVIPIPKGCIVNNGFDAPLIIEDDVVRRADPNKGDIGIGMMGVYIQNRLFYVGQSGKIIYASDFLKPTKFTMEDTNITGFMCPDEDEVITAIGRQKSIIGTVEGGNLIWSSTKDIYSADVRGTRSEWSNLGSSVGKVSETVPGFSASSSYSFESFNTNVYFRTKQYGLADMKQSEYQFVSLDTVSSQSIEASYYFDNDTDWMLNKCYTRACNRRLFTTVNAERNEAGFTFWNGLLSFHPAALYSGQGTIPRRFESVFTGVRPWCITVISPLMAKDIMYIHSHDKDNVNRLYVMDELADYDIDNNGNVREIEGFIETKAYTLKNPYFLKSSERRFYRLNLTSRSTKIKLFSRPEVQGQWTEMWNAEHLICRTRLTDGHFEPEAHKGQTRALVNVSADKPWPCYPMGNKFIAVQYRIEFKGPLNLDSFIITGTLVDHDKTISKPETECTTLVYNFLPDYNYSIAR